MNSGKILFLTQEDTIKAGALDMSISVPTMEQVHSLHDKKDYVLPPKCVLRWGEHDSENTKGRINSMPGWIGGDINAVGIKWIASAPQNPFKYNLPRASAVIVLNDPDTLVPIAIMDGTAISASRTGANTGVASKYLAKKTSRTLGLIGAGVQNRTQLLAIIYSHPEIETIKIYDLHEERAQNFADEMSIKTGKEISVVKTAYEAVKNSDIFVTATVTETPIVKSEWIEPGVFYSHVGSHECEFEAILKMDKRIVDDWSEIKHRGVESLAIMYNTGMINDSSIYAEIGQIINNVKKGREDDTESIYFNTVGMGIEDVALAHKIYLRALKMNIGQKLSLWEKPFAV